MDTKIRLHMKDWQFNMGLLGFYNVLRHADIDVKFQDDYIEFDEEELKKNLEGFEEKYFSYLIDKYGKLTHWQKLSDICKELEMHKAQGYSNFKENGLKGLNDFITELKNHLKKDNYTKVYQFIKDGYEIKCNAEELKNVKLNKNQDIQDIIPELEKQIDIIKKIEGYVFSESGKKYLFAKCLIYNVIQNLWNGISFLNQQNNKEQDIYKAFKEYFTDKTLEYISENKSEYKLKCFTTGLPVKNLGSAYDLCFLVDTGFDKGKKLSNIWDYNNDIFICDLARLIYICMPCAITYSTFKDAVFINANRDFENLKKVNENIFMSIKRTAEDKDKAYSNKDFITYKALIQAMQKKTIELQPKYELLDIQVIRLNQIGGSDNMRYRFNILSKEVLELLSKHSKELDKLIPCGFIDGKTYIYIYPTVIDNIINKTNLFNFIHLLLSRKLDVSLKNFYSDIHIYILNIINSKFMEAEMEKENKLEHERIVKDFKNSGYYLGEAYRDKNAENRINGIAYRLLNALKTRNAELFLHTILNCYMYINKPVPKDMEKVLLSDVILAEIGYAFVTGLTGSILKEEKTTK